MNKNNTTLNSKPPYVINVASFPTATPIQTANDLEAEWKKLQALPASETGNEPQQLVLIRKCFWKIVKKEGVSLSDLTQDLDEYVHDIWIHVANRFENKTDLITYIAFRNQTNKARITLVTLICMSVNAILEREKNKSKKASSHFVTASACDEDFCNDLVDAAALSGHGISVEDTALIRTELTSFWNNANENDRKIFVLLSHGYTEREIGRSVGLKTPHNRIVKIRKILESAGLKKFL